MRLSFALALLLQCVGLESLTGVFVTPLNCNHLWRQVLLRVSSPQSLSMAAAQNSTEYLYR